MPRNYRDSRSGRNDSYPRSPWFEEREINGETFYFPAERPESDYDSDHSGHDNFQSPRYSNSGGPGSGRRRDFSPQPDARTPRLDQYYEDEFNRYTRPHSSRSDPNTPGFVFEDAEAREQGRRRSSRPRERSPPLFLRPRSPQRSLWSRIFRRKSPSPSPQRRRHGHRRSKPVATMHFGQGSAPFPDGAYRLKDGQVYKMKRRSGSRKYRK